MDEQTPDFAPILVAEDSIDDVLMLEVVLKRARILNPLQVVQDGDLAIEYIRGEGRYADRTAHPYPILFLLDLKMPKKGGMDVLRWLGENPPQIPLPVVVIAGKGEMREVNCAYSLGARSFLVKPLNWLDVMELLSCFRELRLAAHGDQYVLEAVSSSPAPRLAPKPALLGYKPQPLDTSRLKLTDDILRLTELLAENNHEVWARDRMQQGWTWGPQRDDEKREHPCLVPYRDLPESEKLVDRNVAIETIKTIFSFGLPHPVLENATTQVRSEVIQQTITRLQQQTLKPHDLATIWDEHNSVVWSQAVELYRTAAAAALQFSEAFLAFEIIAEGLKKYDGDIQVRQMQALAFAQTGALEAAAAILEQLRSSAPEDAETLGRLGHTYKTLGTLGENEQKRRHLKLSFELYQAAYERTRSHEYGLNAAATGILYGEKNAAVDIAMEIEQMCRAALRATPLGSEQRCLLQASLGESLLIQGNTAEAEQSYRHASNGGANHWRILVRARSEARLLLARMGRSRHELDGAFALPRIIACWGEMFDKPESADMRFPFGLEDRLREIIRQKLSALQAQIGFSSLSSGAELIFAETILERGGDLHVVLPGSRQEFKMSNVDIIPGARLPERFDKVLAQAATVTILEKEARVCEHAALADYCSSIIIGKALLKGRMLGLDVTPLAIGEVSAAANNELLTLCRRCATPVELISIDQLLEQVTKDIFVQQRKKRVVSSSAVQPRERTPQSTKAIILAEIVGRDRLTTGQQGPFIEHFVTIISKLVQSRANKPAIRHVSDDTIRFVFDDVSEAGVFALALQQRVSAADWNRFGLPADLSLRMTLHAGPAYSYIDPLSQQTMCTGLDLDGPIGAPDLGYEGQVYATEAFAALSESFGVKEYVCDFIGRKQLSGQYGSTPVFLVRPQY